MSEEGKVTFYPTAALREAIDQVLEIEEPEGRLSDLRILRDELEGLQGLVQRYTDDAERQREVRAGSLQ